MTVQTPEGRPLARMRWPATMPMTPLWAVGSSTRSKASSVGGGRRAVRSRWMVRRSRLRASTRAMRVSASARSRVSSRRTASSAPPMRPTAFSLGASPKPMSWAPMAPSFFAARSRATSPGPFFPPRESRPRRTRRAFSSTRGITSATVPIATSLRRPSRKAASAPAGCGATPRRAWASLKATPTPARNRLGYAPRWGCTTAQAAGSSAPRAWWSVITQSRPSAVLALTSSRLRTPQSTEMSSPGSRVAFSSWMQSRWRP